MFLQIYPRTRGTMFSNDSFHITFPRQKYYRVIPFNIHCQPSKKKIKVPTRIFQDPSEENARTVTLWLSRNFRSSQYWPSENLKSVLVTFGNVRFTPYTLQKISTLLSSLSENFVNVGLGVWWSQSLPVVPVPARLGPSGHTSNKSQLQNANNKSNFQFGTVSSQLAPESTAIQYNPKWRHVLEAYFRWYLPSKKSKRQSIKFFFSFCKYQ